MAKKSHGGDRPGSGRPKSERDDVSVKVDRGVIAKAAYVARLKGVTLAEYVSETLRPMVDKEFTKASKGDGQP